MGLGARVLRIRRTNDWSYNSINKSTSFVGVLDVFENTIVRSIFTGLLFLYLIVAGLSCSVVSSITAFSPLLLAFVIIPNFFWRLGAGCSAALSSDSSDCASSSVLQLPASDRNRPIELYAFLVGVLVLTVPALGDEACLLLVLGFVYTCLFTNHFSPRPLAGLAIILLTWNMVSAGAIWNSFVSIYDYSSAQGQPLGILSIAQLLPYLPDGAVLSLLASAKFLLACSLLFIFSSHSNLREFAAKGTIIGAIIAFTLSFLQLVLPVETFPTQRVFWTELGRRAGSFSDPNAFGLVSFLLVPFLLIYGVSEKTFQKRFFLSFAVAWFLIGLFAGSRTQVGAMFVFVCLYSLLTKPKHFLGAVAVTSLVGVLLFLVVPVGVIKNSAPSSVRRLITTVESITGEETPAEPTGHLLESNSYNSIQAAASHATNDSLNSRKVFWVTGALIWLGHPFWGVGPGRFSHFFPQYAAQAGFDVGLWTDNSNNFYLGLLCELGLVGSVAVVIFLLSFRWHGIGYTPAKRCLSFVGIGVFCLALLTGPHLSFIEVAWVFSLLFASVASVNSAVDSAPSKTSNDGKPIESLHQEGFSNRLVRYGLLFVLVTSGLGLARGVFWKEQGLYGWEKLDASAEKPIFEIGDSEDKGSSLLGVTTAGDAKAASYDHAVEIENTGSEALPNGFGISMGSNAAVVDGFAGKDLSHRKVVQQSWYRWTAQRAVFSVQCFDGFAQISLRSMRPGVGTSPQRYSLRSSDGRFVDGVLRTNRWYNNQFSCSENNGTKQRVGSEEISLVVVDPWVPARELVGSEDRRLLGVQLAVFDRSNYSDYKKK